MWLFYYLLFTNKLKTEIMNKKISYIVIAVASLAIVHLIASYIMWDINPSHWPQGVRFSGGMLMMLALTLNAIIISEQESKNK
mgnify:FL=1